jgi:hypothetical protein
VHSRDPVNVRLALASDSPGAATRNAGKDTAPRLGKRASSPAARSLPQGTTNDSELERREDTPAFPSEEERDPGQRSLDFGQRRPPSWTSSESRVLLRPGACLAARSARKDVVGEERGSCATQAATTRFACSASTLSCREGTCRTSGAAERGLDEERVKRRAATGLSRHVLGRSPRLMSGERVMSVRKAAPGSARGSRVRRRRIPDGRKPALPCCANPPDTALLPRLPRHDWRPGSVDPVLAGCGRFPSNSGRRLPSMSHYVSTVEPAMPILVLTAAGAHAGPVPVKAPFSVGSAHGSAAHALTDSHGVRSDGRGEAS